VAREFERCHVLLMAAAPADFRPERAAAEKLKRAEGGMELRLAATEDILASVAASKTGEQTVIGFAAEHGGDPVGRAREKLARKGADLIVLNDVSRPEIGFESERNEVTLVEPGGEQRLEIDSKEAIADAILDRVEQLRAYTEVDGS
jgi:phosphopantothenoylcysteine decarboxylase / phosphopantothenate---cysteine ligase